MARAWPRLVHILELGRIELVFASISNAWLIVFLSRHVEPMVRQIEAVRPPPAGMPLSVLLPVTAVASAGLAVYGLALNDVLDVRRDRAMAPTRPIPAGRVALPAAVVVSVTALLLALAAATVLGKLSIFAALAVAAAALFYNATGKYLPAVGAVSLGLIHAGAMLVPNPRMGYVWPVLLVFTHVTIYATITHRLEGKRPRMSGAELSGVVAGWTFITLTAVAIMSQGGVTHLDEGPGVWLGPIAAACLYAIVAVLITRHHLSSRRQKRLAAVRFGQWAALAHILLDLGWLAALGLWFGFALGLGLAALAILTRGAVELLAHITEPPPTYRLGPSSL